MSAEVTRSACAKIILCGEHAVVYGRPAIALPLSGLRSRATVAPWDRPFRICAPDIHAEFDLSADQNRPLAVLTRLVFEYLQRPPARAKLTLTSEIPAASHLGSSASVAVACARAVAAYAGRELAPSEASRMAFEAEKIYHGSPSGIDNTVIAFEQPVWYVRGQRTQSAANAPAANASASYTPMAIPRAPVLVVADTGIATPTRIPVGDVRAGWDADPQRYESLFDQIAALATRAREALEASDWPALGRLMDANHALLQQLDVSCRELDNLCDAARAAGALGAKLSGGGRGGNLIALACDEQDASRIRTALTKAGAARVI
jgi:mevalonate kinase